MATNILCIETSTEICSVCISKDGENIGIEESKGFKHSAQLMPSIIALLQKCDLSMKDLDAIGLSKGPGSYTGLRVGASTAKGLAYSLDIPLLGVNTLKSLAFISKSKVSDGKPYMYMPMIDARRNEVYTAIYDEELQIIKPTQAFILNDLENVLDPDHTYLLCGNGAKKVEEYTALPSNGIIQPSQCSSLGLCRLSFEAYVENDFEELDHFEPEYLKPPNIAKPKTHF